MLKKIVQYSGQALFYGLFVAFIGYFSVSPAYVHFPPGQALIKVSFSHAGQPLEECRVRTAEELEKLPPNMRVPMLCGRERSPVMFELELNGKPLYRAELTPAGLSRDGVSTVYQRFPVPAGQHRLRARLKDSVRVPDFNYSKDADVTVVPGQVFVVDFNARTGGFLFR
ncbi:MAG: hypothetical protein OEM83_03155 [Gammaproteobacteria bacterium]|nr:hypothetical protein [Gammaproteobacteria bacterium]MDH5512148.1 hypothetical protein [Gammaproteobacteria bacterium]